VPHPRHSWCCWGFGVLPSVGSHFGLAGDLAGSASPRSKRCAVGRARAGGALARWFIHTPPSPHCWGVTATGAARRAVPGRSGRLPYGLGERLCRALGRGAHLYGRLGVSSTRAPGGYFPVRGRPDWRSITGRPGVKQFAIGEAGPFGWLDAAQVPALPGVLRPLVAALLPTGLHGGWLDQRLPLLSSAVRGACGSAGRAAKLET
jgi:hypothetical protein